MFSLFDLIYIYFLKTRELYFCNEMKWNEKSKVIPSITAVSHVICYFTANLPVIINLEHCYI